MALQLNRIYWLELDLIRCIKISSNINQIRNNKKDIFNNDSNKKTGKMKNEDILCKKYKLLN